MTAEAQVLAARGVTVRFSGSVALDDVDLELDRGEVVGLAGPNGAGKSTLLDVLVGRRTPSSGRVLLDGRDVTRSTPRERAALGVGMVVQGGRVLGHLDVSAHLALGRLAAERVGRAAQADGSDGVEVVTAALAAEGVLGAMLAGGLAHGSQQWLELAMVLATRPRVLLLDEPTSGMDRGGRRRTAALLRDLHAADPMLTTVIVEHDATFIAEVADRVVVLAAGRIEHAR